MRRAVGGMRPNGGLRSGGSRSGGQPSDCRSAFRGDREAPRFGIWLTALWIASVMGVWGAVPQEAAAGIAFAAQLSCGESIAAGSPGRFRTAADSPDRRVSAPAARLPILIIVLLVIILLILWVIYRTYQGWKPALS